MADIFLSYKSEDRPFVSILASVLSDEGYSVWYDKGLSAETPYHEQIAEWLKRARLVIAIWTPRSSDSRWVYSEADEADKQSKLVNVGIGNVIPPKPFDRLNCRDLTSWEGSHADERFQLLLDDISRALDRVEGRNEAERSVPQESVADRVWLHIKDSIDAAEYHDFIERYRGDPRTRQAEHHLRQLADWANVDRSDAASIRAFILTGPYQALGRHARETIDALGLAEARALEDKRLRQREEEERKAHQRAERAFEAKRNRGRLLGIVGSVVAVLGGLAIFFSGLAHLYNTIIETQFGNSANFVAWANWGCLLALLIVVPTLFRWPVIIRRHIFFWGLLVLGFCILITETAAAPTAYGVNDFELIPEGAAQLTVASSQAATLAVLWLVLYCVWTWGVRIYRQVRYHV